MTTDVVAGLAAGFTSKIVEHPLDTIKVRLQTSSEVYGIRPWHCFTTICKTEGPMTLFKGIPAPILAAMVSCLPGSVSVTLCLC